MKKKLTLIALLLLPLFTNAQQYIFFLHNMFLELYPLGEKHPDYGRVEYNEVISAFNKNGFTVISEIRPKGTDAKQYAGKVVKQIDSLIQKGVKAKHITVIGTSKGGYIAEYVSGYLKNKEVNFVFIGCCDSNMSENPEVPYYGNILSIYEESDRWKSCQKMREFSGTTVVHFKEIKLNTGLKHGYLYRAADNWMQPSMKWAKGQYD